MVVTILFIVYEILIFFACTFPKSARCWLVKFSYFFSLALDSLGTNSFVFSHIIEKMDKVREFWWNKGSLVRAIV